MSLGRPVAAPPRNRGGGERVGEHQRSVRELAVGFFGREGGWRRGLRGSLMGGGANGGRRQLWTPCGTRSGARSWEERRIRTSGSSWNGLGGPGRDRGRARSAGAIRRRRGASTAVLGVRARDGAAWRGRAGWGGRFGRTRWRGGGLAGRAVRGVRPTASGRPGRNRGGEGEQRERERERDEI